MFEMMMNRRPQTLAVEQIYQNYYFIPQLHRWGQMHPLPAFPPPLQRPQPQTQQQSSLPGWLTVTSAVVYLASDNEAVKTLALQAFGIAGTAWLNQHLN
jgi:hypothetical protein